MNPRERDDTAAVPPGRDAAMQSRAEDHADDPDRQARQEAWRGLDLGSVMSVELITATLVWFGIGWLLDNVLGTKPWFMFAGALLGNWAGLYLIWLRGQRSEAAALAAKSRIVAAPGSSEQKDVTR